MTLHPSKVYAPNAARCLAERTHDLEDVCGDRAFLFTSRGTTSDRAKLCTTNGSAGDSHSYHQSVCLHGFDLDEDVTVSGPKRGSREFYERSSVVRLRCHVLLLYCTHYIVKIHFLCLVYCPWLFLTTHTTAPHLLTQVL